MKKLAILLTFIVIGQNVFLSNAQASLGRIAECFLKRTINKQHTLPSKFKEIISPKRVGAVVHWGSILSPFFPLIKTLNNPPSINEQIMHIPSSPLDAKTKNIIKREIGINTDNIRKLYDPDERDKSTQDIIYLSENTIKNLNSDDIKIMHMGFGTTLHEYNHIQNKDHGVKNVFISYTEGIVATTIFGKIIKPVRFGCGYIQSILNGTITAKIKDVFGCLNIERNRRLQEYAADNIHHENAEKNYKILGAREDYLSKIDDNYNFLREKNMPEYRISFFEIFSSHPDTKKRIAKTQEYKKDLLSKHPELAKKVEDGTIWQIKKIKRNKNFLERVVGFITFGKY
jgi:hypothetical protein